MYLKINKNGFTLIEVIVVAAIIAVLAGILVPLIFKEIDEAKISRASADIRTISSAIIVFKKDNGQWPIKDNTCAAAVTLLHGDGIMPTNLAANSFDAASSSSFNDHLSANASNCYTQWKGPYIAMVSADPWGNSYIVNAGAFSDPTKPAIWIISAGPNGAIDTPAGNTTVVGDDIGLRLQ